MEQYLPPLGQPFGSNPNPDLVNLEEIENLPELIDKEILYSFMVPSNNISDKML